MESFVPLSLRLFLDCASPWWVFRWLGLWLSPGLLCGLPSALPVDFASPTSAITFLPRGCFLASSSGSPIGVSA